MPISITQALNIQEARLGFPELDSFIRWHQVTLAPETAAALVVPNDALPRHLGVDTEMLLLLLPSELARHAEALAIGELVSDNELSEDLLTSDTLLSVETTHVAVDMNVRDISNSFPTEENEGWFYVGVAAGDRFVIGQHCLGRLWVEAFPTRWRN